MAISYQSGFNSGELTRKMDGRSDLEIYRNGCSLLENFYVLPQGGVERRVGTEYLSDTYGLDYTQLAEDLASYEDQLDILEETYPNDYLTSGSDSYNPTEDIVNTFTFNDSGTKLWYRDYNVAVDETWIRQCTLTTPFDLSTVSASTSQRILYDEVFTESINIYGIAWKDDGTAFYILRKYDSTSNWMVDGYNVSTPWDVTTVTNTLTPTAGRSPTITDPVNTLQDLHFSEDGKSFYVGVGDEIRQYSSATAWDLSEFSLSETFTIPETIVSLGGMFFSSNGDEVFYTHEGGGSGEYDLYVRELSTAWDLSTIGAVTKTFDIENDAPNWTGPEGLYISYNADSGWERIFSANSNELKSGDFSEHSTLRALIATTEALIASGEPVEGAKKARLIPFIFSASQAYACEFGDGYIKIWEPDGSTSYTPTGTVPYSADDVGQIDYYQRFDILYLSHPNYPVQELKRTSVTPAFEIGELAYDFPPLLDENAEDVWLTSSGTSGSVTIDSWANEAASTTYDLFSSDMVGSNLFLRFDGFEQDPVSGSNKTASFTSAALNVSYSTWTVSTTDTWAGKIYIEISYDGGTTWETLTKLADTKTGFEANFSYPSPSKSGSNTSIRIKFEFISGSLDYRITNNASSLNALAVITGYTDAHTVTATLIDSLSGVGATDATKKWSESAFSDKSGYPRALSFYENRMWLAGSDLEPSTIHASVSGDYYNFLTGEESDLAIRRIPDNPEEAQWLVSGKKLFLGSEGSVAAVESVDDRELISASNIKTISQGVYGSSNIGAILANDVALYSQRNNLKLRELIYNYDVDSFVSNDITILNDAILESGLTELFLQKQPDQVVWCMKNNGDTAVLTYERQQEVVGWGRITTNGNIISGCAIPSEGGEDTIFLCVERISGVAWEAETSYTIGDIVVYNGIRYEANTTFTEGETFTAANWDEAPQYTIEKLKQRADADWYVDGGVYTATPASSLSGLDHLEGMEVQVVGDDSYIGDYTVSGGSITLDKEYDTILAGLSYGSVLQTMPIEPILANRLPNSRVKGAVKATIKFLNTIGGKVGEKDKQLTSYPALNTFDPSGQPLELKSGETQFNIGSDWEREKILEIRQDLPYPMTVLSMAVWTEVKGG